jgi:ankyrin repeat protein
VKLLASKGSDLNAKNSAGVTPLAAAVRNGHAGTADLLRSLGARE